MELPLNINELSAIKAMNLILNEARKNKTVICFINKNYLDHNRFMCYVPDKPLQDIKRCKRDVTYIKNCKKIAKELKYRFAIIAIDINNFKTLQLIQPTWILQN